MKVLQLISPNGKVVFESLIDERLEPGETKLLRTVTMVVAATRVVETDKEVKDEATQG